MSSVLTEIVRPDPPGQPMKFAGFTIRLMWPPVLFALSHVVWAIYATVFIA